MQTVDVPPPAAVDDDDRLRAETWALLAALLRRTPDAALLSRLAAIDPQAVAVDTALATGWRRLRAAAADAQPAALDDEFHALFIGTGRGELLPFASWYLTGFLMEKPLALLRADLAKLGFERQPGVCEPEDHIGALAEVLALLIGEGAAAAPVFFARHVEPWAGRLFADLQTAESARFYRAVGDFAAAFLNFERQYGAMPAAVATGARCTDGAANLRETPT